MTEFDPTLDLQLVRILSASPVQVWRCWTKPELLMQWFAPKPWGVDQAVIDPRPGGRFFTRMVGPDGTQMPSEGCIIEAIPERKLCFTDAMSEGYRPNTSAFMTASIAFEDLDPGTRYTVTIQHATAEAQQQHADMGFEGGWGSAATQLDTLANTL